ncbi:hypothetical protein HPB50_001782 [Hyalomma asiaticum]|uniref:Uncharacterized protein n=1 Tax=Hyalomma asiaticum TaxID=266040 RepID=A0ACB7T7U5_HYAAI|nr:hypothetical protein HPB50_001782 [Hyalomma asiaticum]
MQKQAKPVKCHRGPVRTCQQDKPPLCRSGAAERWDDDDGEEGKSGKEPAENKDNGLVATLMGLNPLQLVRRHKVERKDSLEVLRKRRMNKEENAEPFPLQQCLGIGLTAFLVIVMVVYVVVGSCKRTLPVLPDDVPAIQLPFRYQGAADDARERDLVFLPTDDRPAPRRTTSAASDTPTDEPRDDDEGAADVTRRTTSLRT